MSRLIRRHALLAGVALILLINAVALAGVWYNRSGEADSRLPLSERELNRAYREQRENSGVVLQLQWRTPSRNNESPRYIRRLEETQMRQLGFPSERDNECEPRCRHQTSREVLVVLELDGPAYQAELARQRQLFEQARLAQAALPEDKQQVQRLENETRELDRIERDTRLYAVDVGLDRDQLRQRYPDRSRYAIVQGLVRPDYGRERSLNGYISELSIEQINVPQRWRPVLATLPSGPNNTSRTPQHRIEVAFGQRLEPWITAVSEATQD